MDEPTRKLPSLTPLSHGGWMATSSLSSPEYTIRGLALKPPGSVIPVIVVPGIMGTNLRARLKPRLGRMPDERNEIAKPGEAVWRPPNTDPGGLWDSVVWADLPPQDRQRLFDAATLEVDDSGPQHIPHGDGRYHVDRTEARQRWWGEVHPDSYTRLLCTLQTHLNHTFWRENPDEERHIAEHWKEVMSCEPQRWGVKEFEPLTVTALEKHARHYYPVYACGYNWLESCEKSSQRLEARINEIIESWKDMKRGCDQVILVTHSMGGLVARACAKRIPEKIAGVIHGVMPALGAPAAYRRIACGTETSSPSNGIFGDFAASRLAKILGDTTDQTTPVLAVSPGALELLPNQRYPSPWLHAKVTPANSTAARGNDVDYLRLPDSNRPDPYKLYRDMTSWYRLINPALADPAGKYTDRQGGVVGVIKSAIGTAEKFHLALAEFYHPNTYAFFGDDPRKLSFGKVQWVAQQAAGQGSVLTVSNVATAEFVDETEKGGRRVRVEGMSELLFEPAPQDIKGDGTVPCYSGAGPAGKIKQLFETRGYGHQGSYNDKDMLLLTLRLIVRIGEKMP